MKDIEATFGSFEDFKVRARLPPVAPLRRVPPPALTVRGLNAHPPPLRRISPFA